MIVICDSSVPPVFSERTFSICFVAYSGLEHFRHAVRRICACHTLMTFAEPLVSK